MYKTQFDLLQKIESLYSDIVRMTAQIDLDKEEHEQILTQRDILINEVAALQKQRAGLEPGANNIEINDIERRIQSLILAALSDSQTLIEKVEELQVSLKKEILGSQKSVQAAKAYAAHSNYH